MTKAKEFVNENIKKLSEYNMNSFCKVDQSRICNKFHSCKTLNIKDTKKLLVLPSH